MTSGPTVGEVAEFVRSKNAGPFWQTLDIFLPDESGYRTVAESPSIDASTNRAPLQRLAPQT